MIFWIIGDFLYAFLSQTVKIAKDTLTPVYLRYQLHANDAIHVRALCTVCTGAATVIFVFKICFHSMMDS